MALVIRHNQPAANALTILNQNQTALSKSLARISSAQRVTGAMDDTSGYAISERLRVMIRGLDQDVRNTHNGKSMLEVAEGAISSTIEILRTMKERAINAANDSNTDSDRVTLQKEYDQFIDQIDDNASVTYNGKYLVDGSKNRKVTATQNSLTNFSLSESTTGKTAFSVMKNRQEESLNIEDGDTIELSWVKKGKAHTVSVTGSKNMEDLLAKANALVGTAETSTTRTETVYTVNGVSTTDSSKVLRKDYVLISMAHLGCDNTNSTAASISPQINAIRDSYEEFIEQFKYKPEDVIPIPEFLVDLLADSTYHLEFGASVPDRTKNYYEIWLNNSERGNISTNWFFQNRVMNPSDILYTTDYTLTKTPAVYCRLFYKEPNLYDNVTDSTILISVGVCALYDANMEPVFVDARDWQGKNIYQDILAYPGVSPYYIPVQESLEEVTETTPAEGAVFEPAALSENKVGTDENGEQVTTANNEHALTIRAFENGVDGQVAGVAFKVIDKDGNIKRSATETLNSFSETVRGEDSSEDNALVIHTGTKANQCIKTYLTDMRSAALGLKSKDGDNISVLTQEYANVAINVLDNALQKTLDEQTRLGSILSRLEYTEANLITAGENAQASESTYRDADMAKEMTAFTKNNMLSQAAQSMLAQANQNASGVLSLLQ